MWLAGQPTRPPLRRTSLGRGQARYWRVSLNKCLTVGLLAVTLLGGQSSLPPQVRYLLDRQFPGWTFATVTPDYGPGTSPAWLAIDFDGDGQMDYAVQVVAGSQAGGAVQRVIAFLRRGAGYSFVPLDSFPPATTQYLRRVPAGTVRENLDAPAGSGRTFRLPQDGLEIAYGDQAAKTCWYAAEALHCVLTGD